MERWAIRKRLRKIYRYLLDDRAALDRASELVRDKWMKDVLFIMGCRRVIMMNLLDRELGTLPVRVDPRPGASFRFDKVLALWNVPPGGLEDGLLKVCTLEEGNLLSQLRDLRTELAVAPRAVQIITELIREVEDNLADLRLIGRDGRRI